MPQASDELRAKWGIMHFEAMDHLQRRGYVLTPEYLWLIPEDAILSDDDVSAATFLVDEWDFGGFVRKPLKPASVSVVQDPTPPSSSPPKRKGPTG